MMGALWSDVEGDLASAKYHLTQAVALFDRQEFSDGRTVDYYDAMAFLHAMQSGYTSFEAALKRIFMMLGEPLPVGSDSHALLLKRASRALTGSRPAILNEALARAGDELRSFRHVAMHVYDRFDPGKAAPAVASAIIVLTEIDAALARFRAAIDP